MPTNSVDAVDRAITILQAFDAEQDVLSLADLAQRTGFHKSTILRLIGSLEKFQLLSRTQVGGYRLGPELRRLGRLSAHSFDFETAIRPALAELVRTTEETASFYVKHGEQRLCLYRTNSPKAMRHHLNEGVCLRLDRGAAGHVIVAHTGGADAASRRIREQGHCVSYGERDPDVASVAVPLFDDGGGFLGALTVSGLVSRFGERTVALALSELQRSSAQLSRIIPHERGNAA